MTESAWIALASLAAAMFIQAVIVAFIMGRLFQDVATLKNAGPERAVQGLAIARLEVQIGHVSTTLDKLSGTIDERLGFLQKPPPYAPQPRPRRRPLTGAGE